MAISEGCMAGNNKWQICDEFFEKMAPLPLENKNHHPPSVLIIGPR